MTYVSTKESRMKLIFAAAACAAIAIGQGAFAQPPSDELRTEAARVSSPGEQPVLPKYGMPDQQVVGMPSELDMDQTLDLDQLSDLRGGEAAGFQLTNQNLNATNAGNSVIAGDTVGSGAVNLNANAFNGYDGIGNFVINTGHNNNLLGSVSVNVMVTPQ